MISIYVLMYEQIYIIEDKCYSYNKWICFKYEYSYRVIFKYMLVVLFWHKTYMIYSLIKEAVLAKGSIVCMLIAESYSYYLKIQEPSCVSVKSWLDV